MEYIADSEDEDMLVNPSLDPANTSTAVESVKAADTILYSPAKNPGDSVIVQTLSQPPITVLPEATTSSASSTSIPSTNHIHLDSRHDHATESYSSIINPSSTGVSHQPLAPKKRRPRPKPRPAYKVTVTEDAIPSTTSVTSNISSFGNTSSGNPPNPPPQETIGEWSSGHTASATRRRGDAQASDISAFSQDIAERAKMRSRTRAAETSKKKPKATAELADVIELTSSSDDELSLLPPARSKTKTNAKAKSNRAPPTPPAHRSPMRAQLLDDIEGPSSTIGTVPVPTSDFPLPSSILPPSDPPFPSSSSMPSTSNPGPPQSPPSSPIPMPVRKRKRAGIPPGEDEDELDRIKTTRERDSQRLMPPPPVPTTAAASNSSPSVDHAPGDSAFAGSSKDPPRPKPRARKKAVDDEEEDWTGEPKPKATRQRKKDVNSSESKPGSTSKKGKGKAVPRAVMEVVLDRKTSISPQKVQTKEGSNFAMSPPGNSRDNSPEPELTDLTNEDEKIDRLGVEKNGRRGVSRSGKDKGANKGKGRAQRLTIVSSDEEDFDSKDQDGCLEQPVATGRRAVTRKTPPSPREPSSGYLHGGTKTPSKLVRTGSFKENNGPVRPSNSPDNAVPTSKTEAPRSSTSTPLPRSSSVIPKLSTPMSELIRRVNSKPGSPFASPRSTYSPYTKASKHMLRRIAPLHPHRRTPPPPPPRPPPPKKTKKQLELEEQWEMELEENVEGWFCLSEGERAALRRAKRDAAMGFDD